MASLVANYGSDEDSYTDSEDDTAAYSAIKEEKTTTASEQNFFENAASSSSESETEDSKMKDQKERLPNPLSTGLPHPVLDSDNEKELLSVFTNPFKEAEQAKNTVLEKHVKMVERNIPKGKAGQICFKFKKGKCPYGKNCRYSHDLSSELISKPVAVVDEQQHSAFSSYHHTITCQTIESEREDDESYMAQAKRKKRSGINDHLVPPKKAMKSLDKERHNDRPWTIKK